MNGVALACAAERFKLGNSNSIIELNFTLHRNPSNYSSVIVFPVSHIIGGSRGRAQRTPRRVQNLLFRHAKFSKRHPLGSRRPYEFDAPLRDPGSALALEEINNFSASGLTNHLSLQKTHDNCCLSIRKISGICSLSIEIMCTETFLVKKFTMDLVKATVTLTILLFHYFF